MLIISNKCKHLRKWITISQDSLDYISIYICIKYNDTYRCENDNAGASFTLATNRVHHRSKSDLGDDPFMPYGEPQREPWIWVKSIT